MEKYRKLIDFIRSLYPNKDFISLHEPRFVGNERSYVMDAIDSTFVSSVGSYVNKFEEMLSQQTNANHSIAIVNGTNALHLAMEIAGVVKGDEVITQALTFIATTNAISYIGAKPVFIDVDLDTLGISPTSLAQFLLENCEKKSDGYTYNKLTGCKIAACVPMHTFGLSCRIDEIANICKEWNVVLVEDAAESIGSFYKEKHTGTFGKLGVFSFNGNKTLTCGGGGAIVTNDTVLAQRAKHLSTQAKIPHKWKFEHDSIGYNYRMPNINAALACAQMEKLDEFVENKRNTTEQYHKFGDKHDISFVKEIDSTKSNYWLNAVICENAEERDAFLQMSNNLGVNTRPIWELMNRLKMFNNCQNDGLKNSIWLADRIVNIPSSVR